MKIVLLKIRWQMGGEFYQTPSIFATVFDDGYATLLFRDRIYGG